MAFYESPRFPEGISYGAIGGPEWLTGVVTTITGYEQRDGRLLYPRQRWDVSHGVRTAAEFAALRAYFLTMRGRLHGFRYKDWTDYTAAHTGNEKGIVTGLTSTTFQAFKRYTSGSQTMDRKISKIVDAAGTLRAGEKGKSLAF